MINTTYHTLDDSKLTEEMALLNIRKGSQMCLYEKVDDAMYTNNKFNIEISDITDKYPTEINSNRYNLALIVPMETYLKIVGDFLPDRILESNRMSISLLVGDDASPRVKKELTQIASSYLGWEDFRIWTLLEEINHKELVQEAIKISVSAIALMPILISIPVVFIICWDMLNLTPITWNEYITVFPSESILIYTMLIFITIFSSYWFSSRSVKRSNMIESMRDEIL